MFYHTMELYYEANSIEAMPPFIIDVWDSDASELTDFDGDDYVCRSIIPVSEAVYSTDDSVPRPKWVPCRLNPSAP